MTKKQALKLARECIREKAQKYAPSANIIIGHKNPPAGIAREAERYRELAQVLDILDGMIQQGGLDL
jgi:hypothetical protein